jgi:hypothetical protein
MRALESGSIIWRIPRPLKFVFWGGVTVAAYGVVTFALAIAQGLSPTHIEVGGLPFPFFDPATTAAVLLALGTAALAYSALRQATAQEAQLDSARGLERATNSLAKAAQLQASAMERQLKILDSQLEEARSQAKAAATEAQRAEAVRRATTFPRVHVVTPSSHIDRRPVAVIPGNAYQEWGNPTLGVENLGNGQASDLRIIASWKVYDFSGARTMNGDQLRAIPWEAPPLQVPSRDILDSREVNWVDTTAWLSMYVVGSQQTKRIVALFIRPSWTDPDGSRRRGNGSGLVLIPGSYTKSSDAMGLEYASLVAVEPENTPSEDRFSSEAPLPTYATAGAP